MNLKRSILLLGGATLIAAFALLASFVSRAPLTPFSAATATFAEALWSVRKVDVLLQVMLVFTASLGILTFFETKERQ